MKIIKKLMCILVIIIIINLYPAVNAVNLAETMRIFTFTETIEEFNNPDMGFYRPTMIRCKATGEWPNTKVQYANGLVHLRFGIKSFTQKANGIKDYDITDEHIQELNKYMQQIRDAGGTAIVRFAYDDFEGTSNLEPDINQVLNHIEQLKPFFEQNEDIIACVETGFLGPWGEQHSSKIVTEENIGKVTNKLLEVVPKNRTISVRKPLWYCSATGINLDEIDQNVTLPETDAYRIGIFNDGYLGSASDLGTFKDRAKGLAWLNNQATHTLYGGEVAWVKSINDVDENGFRYNLPEHIESEMFITHTSYLNEEWNDDLIENVWKKTMYSGEDLLYAGSTNYTYIKNHLGYRLVLNEIKMPKAIEQTKTGMMNIKLKNVGAGNVVNEKTTYIVLKNATEEYSIPIQLDIRSIASNSNADINVEIPISKDMKVGFYDVYIKIANKDDDPSTSKRTIRLANKGVWQETIGANRIGIMEIVERQGSLIGDIDEDGYITINDLAKLKLHLIDKQILQGESLKLADIDGDDKITLNDLAKLKLLLIS